MAVSFHLVFVVTDDTFAFRRLPAYLVASFIKKVCWISHNVVFATVVDVFVSISFIFLLHDFGN